MLEYEIKKSKLALAMQKINSNFDQHFSKR